MRLAVLRNPASTGNRGRPAQPLPPGTMCEVTGAASVIRPALERLRAAAPEVLVIDGGDGTVRAVVEVLADVFDQPPPIAILPHGNTNLIARRLGGLAGPAAMDRLAAEDSATLAPRLHTAPVLRLDFAAGETRRGFIAGWGAYAAGTRLAHDEIVSRHGRQVWRAVLATLRRAGAGADGAALRHGVAGALCVEGRVLPGARRFLGVVTSLPGPLVGPFAPFWGAGTGAIRWLDVTAPPRRLALAAPLVLAGRPAGWLRRAGYRSGRAARIELALGAGGGPIVLDGDEVGGPGPLRAIISADECVRVLA